MKRSLMLPLLLLLLVLCAAPVQSEDWRFFIRYEDYFYYDRESVTYPAAPYKGIISLWQKIIYDKDSSFRMAEKLGGKYADVHESIHLVELNCAGAQVRIKAVAYYDSKGGIIDYSVKEITHWKKVPPDTPDEELFQRICPLKDPE
jgi:hypothetical protein